jgi:hypothetical protein
MGLEAHGVGARNPPIGVMISRLALSMAQQLHTVCQRSYLMIPRLPDVPFVAFCSGGFTIQTAVVPFTVMNVNEVVADVRPLAAEFVVVISGQARLMFGKAGCAMPRLGSTSFWWGE